MIKELPTTISEIIRIEKYYGHAGFVYGLNDDSEVIQKYDFVLDLLRILYSCDSSKDSKLEANEMLRGMLTTGILTGEALAILVLEIETDDKFIQTIKKMLYEIERGALAYFESVYYKKTCDELIKMSRFLKGILKKNEDDLESIERVNDVYINRYKGVDVNPWFRGRGAVYTAITGNYDELKDPQIINPEWDYICFTDNPDMYSSGIWKTVKISDEYNWGPVKLQRYAKTHPHILLSEYDYTIYVDGQIEITGDLRDLIGVYSRKCSMLCYPHQTRQNLNDEARAIEYLGKADKTTMLKQLEFYKEQGYNNQTPLIAGGFLIRSNCDDKLINVMEDWWKEISERTQRDQLSIGYCCWKNGYEFDIINEVMTDNKYISLSGHKNRVIE